MEDAKKKLAEQQLEIERLTKKVLDIMNGDYDDRLEEMLTEIEAKEREKDIKLKLKSKLGERCFAESSATITDPPDHVQPAAAQPDLLTTPVSLNRCWLSFSIAAMRDVVYGLKTCCKQV